MTPEDFIERIVESMQSLTKLYAQGDDGGTYLGGKLDDLRLSGSQRQDVLTLIRLAVGEATHSLICGIEGSVALGNTQQVYKLFDETGNQLTGRLGDLLYEKIEGNNVLDTQEGDPAQFE